MNDVQVEIGAFWTFLIGYREVIVDPSKEFLEEVGARLVTQEFIYVSFNY